MLNKTISWKKTKFVVDLNAREFLYDDLTRTDFVKRGFSQSRFLLGKHFNVFISTYQQPELVCQLPAGVEKDVEMFRQLSSFSSL